MDKLPVAGAAFDVHSRNLNLQCHVWNHQPWVVVSGCCNRDIILTLTVRSTPYTFLAGTNENYLGWKGEQSQAPQWNLVNGLLLALSGHRYCSTEYSAPSALAGSASTSSVDGIFLAGDLSLSKATPDPAKRSRIPRVLA